MRGWGVGATLGPASPHSWRGQRVTFAACREREEGACPRLGRAVVAFRLFPMDCTEGSGALKLPPEAQGGVTEHPPFQEQETSSRGRSLPTPPQGLLARR